MHNRSLVVLTVATALCDTEGKEPATAAGMSDGLLSLLESGLFYFLSKWQGVLDGLSIEW
jgi:hypothetical protein